MEQYVYLQNFSIERRPSSYWGENKGNIDNSNYFRLLAGGLWSFSSPVMNIATRSGLTSTGRS